jgi:hypothetical protein
MRCWTGSPHRDEVNAPSRDIAFLYRTGEQEAGKALLYPTMRGRSNTDLTRMVEALRHREQPEPLAAAAEWVRETYARIGSMNVDGILRQVGLNEHTSRGTWLHRRRENS